MNVFVRIFAVLAISIFAISGCTENYRAKTFGGTADLKIPCGKKLITMTWKDNNLWYLTRPMRADEAPEIYTFAEDSSLGVVQGAVIVRECR